ncbi:HAD hydrolase-like protein, partial [Patescibacteria group bacterium]|nr:HAD hydrolase-like protein [Patescibacteria group bacterium]
DPRQCVYVGDLENDVIAAKAAGMKAIIYSKNKIKIGGADGCTSSFKEIPKLVEECL